MADAAEKTAHNKPLRFTAFGGLGCENSRNEIYRCNRLLTG
jgi:hypothetical protein